MHKQTQIQKNGLVMHNQKLRINHETYQEMIFKEQQKRKREREKTENCNCENYDGLPYIDTSLIE